jgi:predicted permease
LTLVLTATLTLAVAIGANTAVFSIVDSILIRPLVYPNSERLYWIAEHTRDRSGSEVGLASDYFSLREQRRAFEEIAAYGRGDYNWTNGDRPELLRAADVSPSFFRVMGVSPALGRYLEPEEEGSKAPPVIVLSYTFWRSRLGSDPQAVGKSIVLNQQTNTIIGVMPQGFDYPPGTQIWHPFRIDESTQRPRLMTRPVRIVSMVARRKADIAPEEIEGEMSRLTAAIHAEYPKEFDSTGFLKGFEIIAKPLQRQLTGDLRPALQVLSGAVGLVLLIACVNLANLQLARGATQRRDLAVRLALGSSRGRIVRDVLAESLALALPGGLLGAGIAWVAVYSLNAAKPAVLALYPPIAMDMRILAFTLALTLLTGLVFGLAPALSASRVDIQEALKGAGQSHSSSRGSARIRQALVVAELGVSLVLLIGAGLLARSFWKLAHVELGFPADRLLTFLVNPVGTPAARAQYYVDVLARIQQLAVVQSAAISTHLPVTNWTWTSGRVQIPGQPRVPLAEQPLVEGGIASRGFFETVKMPLKGGRFFNSEDTPQSEGRIVVNEAFVRRIFPGEDAVGKRITYGREDAPPLTIVGVVGNVRSAALGAEPAPLIYRCTCQTGSDAAFGFVVRTEGDPKSVIRAVEGQVYAVDRNDPIFDMRTMEERLETALAPQRFQLVLIGTFAGIAIILAAAGVYGVMSYLVNRRTREIGIRMAVGASPGAVTRLVLGETAALVTMALGVGWGGGWALTRYLKALLYGVTDLDGVTYALMPVLLATVVLAASLGPARRAARVDPIAALREE